MDDQVNKTKTVHLLLRGDRNQSVALDDEYVRQFKKRDLNAITVPVLDFEYQDLNELAKLLENFPSNRFERGNNESRLIFSGLIITSPRVVEAIARALDLVHKDKRSNILVNFNPDFIFVVGDRSGHDCISKLGINYNKLSANAGNGQALLAFIRNFCNTYTNKESTYCLLYPKGSRSDSTLEDGLASAVFSSTVKLFVQSIVVYQTIPSKKLEASLINELSQFSISKSIQTLIINFVFFSPSGVEGFLNVNLGKLESQIKRKLSPNCEILLRYSSIGETTQATLLENNFTVSCVSDKPNAASLADSILRYSF